VSVFDRGNSQSVQRSLLFNFDNNRKLGKVFDADFGFNYNDKNELDRFVKNYVSSSFTGGSVYGSNGNSYAFGNNVQVQVLPPVISSSNNNINNYGPQVVQPIIPQQQFIPTPNNNYDNRNNDQFVQPIAYGNDQRKNDDYQPQYVPQVFPQAPQVIVQPIPQVFPQPSQNYQQNIRINDNDDRRFTGQNNNPFYSVYPSDV